MCGVSSVRKSNKVPHGKDILNPNWPEAKWDLGGLFVHDNDIFKILDGVKRKYDCILPIESVFGCYGVVWSGGRIACNAHSWNRNGWTPEITIKEYNRRGIGVTFTFSNTLVKEKHLTDPSSNYLLDLLAKQKYDGNAVAIVSDVLSDYIRKKYPDLKQKASICKSTIEMPKRRTLEYYDSLFEKYEEVYLHPDDNLNIKLLEKIAKSGKVDKYTLLINERCTINCTIRKNHYDEISKPVIDGWHGMFNFSNVNFIHDPSHPQSICERWSRKELRSCTLSKSELKNIYDLGFRNFKLQGRDAVWSAMLYNFTVWVFEQDCIAEREFTF
jgi:hypothetical protein